MIPDYRNSPLADMGSWNVSQAKRFFESGMTRNGQEFVRNLFLKFLKIYFWKIPDHYWTFLTKETKR